MNSQRFRRRPFRRVLDPDPENAHARRLTDGSYVTIYQHHECGNLNIGSPDRPPDYCLDCNRSHSPLRVEAVNPNEWSIAFRSDALAFIESVDPHEVGCKRLP